MGRNLTQFPEPPMDDTVPQALPLKKTEPRPKKLDMRAVVENVFDSLGGEEGMVTWVKKSTANERIFYREMLPKLIPREDKVSVDQSGTVDIRHHLNLKSLNDDELAQLEAITVKCVNEQ